MLGVSRSYTTNEKARIHRLLEVRTLLVFVVSILCATKPDVVSAQSSEPPSGYLFLYSGNPVQTSNVLATQGADEVINGTLTNRRDIFAEYRDMHRFPEEAAAAIFRQRVINLYQGRDFEAILVFGGELLDEAILLRDHHFPGTPLVVGGISVDVASARTLPDGVKAAASNFDVMGTVDLARQLQPEASQIVVISGSAPFDQSWQDSARRSLKGLTDIPVKYVSGLTLNSFMETAKSLDPDSILVILTIFQDAAGETFTPAVAARQIASVSASPTYGVYKTFINNGVVGGRSEDFVKIGQSMAEIAISMQAEGDITPEVITVSSTAIVDAQQIARYRLDPFALADDVEVINGQPGIWEKYRVLIVVVALVLVAQTGTILALYVKGRLLRRAEHEIAVRKSDLARASRRDHLSALSGAITHEINQPLTSILMDAEVALDLARGNPINVDELKTVLGDIIDADRRATQIISEMRRLIGQETTNFADLNLNDVISNTLLLLSSELLIREVSVNLKLYPSALPLKGNLTQVKQIIINVMMNAVEALTDKQDGPRVIDVATQLRSDGWRVLVIDDNGPGLTVPGEELFKPFTTGKATGLGLGLSVSRTIIEAHHGTISIDGGKTKGAHVVISFPPP